MSENKIAALEVLFAVTLVPLDEPHFINKHFKNPDLGYRQSRLHYPVIEVERPVSSAFLREERLERTDVLSTDLVKYVNREVAF